jgi:hypothetical protein
MRNVPLALGLAGLTCLVPALEAKAGGPVLSYLRYSFERPEELKDWQCQPGISTELSTEYATDGKSSMKVTAAPRTPWFGVRREVDLHEVRKAEFLEMDLRAATPIYYLSVLLRGGDCQDLQLAYDALEPGEEHHLRIRLTNNDAVQYGDKQWLSIWCGNPTDKPIAWYVDNIRLTGYGGTKGKIAKMRSRMKQRAGEIAAMKIPSMDAAMSKLSGDLEGLLTAETVSEEQVAAAAVRWDAIVRDYVREDLRRRGVHERRFAVGVESSMVKVAKRNTIGELGCPLTGDEMNVTLARHEYEGGQLVLVPLSAAGARDLKVDVTDLTGKEGAAVGGRIPGENIELYLVDDVNINGSDQPPGKLMTGYYPDPLMPNRVFDLEPGRLQCVWVTVYASKDTAPGRYAGRIRINAGGRLVRTVRLEAKVRDFQLPERSTLKTLFGLWTHNWVNFYRYAKYPKGAWFHNPTGSDIPKDNILEVLGFCNRYRMGVDGFLTWGFSQGKIQWPVRTADGGCDFTRGPREGDASWDDIAERVLRVSPTMCAGEIAGKTYTWPEMKDVPQVIAALKDYASRLGRHVHEKGWDGRVGFYMFDEPRSADQWKAAVREAGMVKEAAPNIRTLITAFPAVGEDDRKPFDTHVTLLDRIELRRAHKFQQRGQEVWWYLACANQAPFPYWGLNYDGIDPRIMPLMTFKYGIDGFLQWSADLWGDDNCDPDNPRRWPERAWTCKDWPYQPGEGYMYYPGPGGHPWPSVRLENWRDGMEDYEYLTLLKAKLPELRGEARKKAEELLSLRSVITESYDYTKDPEDIYRMREEVARLVERRG